MPSAADDLTVVDIDADYHLLIPSRFPPVDLFQRIANDEESAVVARVESLTNPRLRAREHAIGISGVDITSPRLQNWNHAPFAYRNPEGSRFFGPDTPVLELADHLQTALAMSVRRREVFLARTGQGRMDLDMRVLCRRITGRFADLRGLGLDDSAARHAAGQRVLGVEPALDGLLYVPPERPGATCAAALHVGALGRARQGDHFRFVWDGERVRSLYSFSRSQVIDPSMLSSVEPVLAA